MTFLVKVENKLEMARRDIKVRRKRQEEIMEEQRVHCPVHEDGEVDGEEVWRKVSFSLGSVKGEKDYVEISVDNQQDKLGPCKIDIRSNGPVTFIPPAAASVTIIPSEYVETNTSLRIPSGFPTWNLVIMRPPEQNSDEGDAVPGLISRDEGSTTNVTVGDEPPGG